MIRVGLVGYGLAGKVFHAPIIDAVEGLALAAVVERSTRNAEKIYPGITTHTSLEAMLDDPTIDAVVLATPNELHFPQAKQVLLAGRHVIVDKPIAAASAEIAELIALSEQQQRYLIPFHNRRWDSDFQTLLKLLHEQKLGAVVSLDSTFDRWRRKPRAGSWREEAGPSTGILLDLGTHLVDQALVLFGPPQGVSAEVLTEREVSVINDAFTIRLRYPGHLVTLGANCLSAFPRPRYSVRGTRGGFIKWGLDPQENLLKADPRVIETKGPHWADEPASAWGTLAIDVDDSIVTQPVKPVPSDYRLYYAAVRDAILGKAAPPVPLTDAWLVARILEWAHESSQLRQEIPCDWSTAPTN